jgi:hypothetical protein
MPTYCYREDGTDELVELTMSVAEMLALEDEHHHVLLPSGKTGRRDFGAEGAKRTPPGNWPQVCQIDGVHPSQVKEAQAESVRIGAPTQFTRDGHPIFNSPHHRKRYYEGIGMYDRNAGYSDPLPKNR